MHCFKLGQLWRATQRPEACTPAELLDSWCGPLLCCLNPTARGVASHTCMRGHYTELAPNLLCKQAVKSLINAGIRRSCEDDMPVQAVQPVS